MTDRRPRLKLTPEMEAFVEELLAKPGYDFGVILLQGLVCFKAAYEARRDEGLKIGLFSVNGDTKTVEREIVGILP